MNVSVEDVLEIGYIEYREKLVRTATLNSGEVIYLAVDVAEYVLGVKNPFRLTQAVDKRCKAELVLSFVEEYNPQRYLFVNLDGLTCMVYRARKSEVNRLDFLNWVQGKGA